MPSKLAGKRDGTAATTTEYRKTTGLNDASELTRWLSMSFQPSTARATIAATLPPSIYRYRRRAWKRRRRRDNRVRLSRDRTNRRESRPKITAVRKRHRWTVITWIIVYQTSPMDHHYVNNRLPNVTDGRDTCYTLDDIVPVYRSVARRLLIYETYGISHGYNAVRVSPSPHQKCLKEQKVKNNMISNNIIFWFCNILYAFLQTFLKY